MASMRKLSDRLLLSAIVLVGLTAPAIPVQAQDDLVCYTYTETKTTIYSDGTSTVLMRRWRVCLPSEAW